MLSLTPIDFDLLEVKPVDGDTFILLKQKRAIQSDYPSKAQIWEAEQNSSNN